ncbi:MAG: ferrous iron transport protein B [Deltaproteobacteria bacterium]|nr:ferrous iron transport protein B [Deltaproteobacteria bacterium]
MPGTYSLSAYSMEEIITRNFLLDEKPDVVVQVVDASNLERNLFLTTQLMELGRPLVLALNLYDQLEKSGARVDAERLGVLLGAPTVTTVGVTGRGVSDLVNLCLETAEKRGAPKRPVDISYGHEIEGHLNELVGMDGLAESAGRQGEYPPRYLAVKLLENDRDVVARLEQGVGGRAAGVLETAAKIREHLQSLFNDDPEMVITERRYGFVSGALRTTYQPAARERASISDLVDRILTHKVLGLPAFFFMIWAMFQLTFNIGQYPMDAIDAGVAWLGGAVTAVMGDGFFRDLIVEGALNGVGFVLVFLPQIFILFWCISLIEDSGYMARVAFLMDRVMRSVGLHGKAFIPLLMGFGCNVPAVMTTRTLDNQRDRILTMMVNPLMSCSARLPVYILLAGTFFTAQAAGTVIFSMYALGIGLAILMAKLFSGTVLKGQAAPFVMELPPYRMPTLRSSMIHMWDRGKVFLRKMGGVILIGSIVVWTLTFFPREAAYTQDYASQIAQTETSLAGLAEDAPAYAALSEQKTALENAMEGERIARSYIGRIGRSMEFFFAPMGFDWQTNVAILTGFVAKEIVVSTYGVIYQVGDSTDETSETLRGKLKRSTLTPLRAFGLMAFILIYTPCLGTIAAIRRETNSWKWTAFSIGYSLVLAYVVALGIIKGGTLLGFA